MNIINQSNIDILNILGGIQCRTKGLKYRLNKYLLEEPCKEGTIIHNFITGATVMIRPYEYINMFTDYPCDYADFLLENYFLVPEEYNELEVIKFIRNHKSRIITSSYLDHPNTYTIFTTTTCNARCFYCYENKSKYKKPMSIETAEKLAKYIIDSHNKYQEVNLDWFGGEPLFNQKVIDIICSRIASAGIIFKSSMVSNGYLFNDSTIEKAAGFWNLRNVQITIDGTESVYNKVKNYIYKDVESPYKVILTNIEKLLKNNIYVSVRMNCDAHNFEDLKELVKELSNIFKDYEGFSMYVWPIFEEGFTRTPEERKILFEKVSEIEDLIQSSGHKMLYGLDNGVKSIHCMADSGECVTVSPDGDLGICEHYIDSKFFSNINNPLNKNFDIIHGWRNYVKPLDKCKDCPIFPQCLRMQGCPDDNNCDEYYHKYILEHYKRCMKDAYIQYNKNERQRIEDLEKG